MICSNLLKGLVITMKLSLKAALLSSVIIPGAGHWLLRRYTFAGIYTGLAVLALVVVMSYVFTATQSLSEQIAHGDIPPEFSVILEHLGNIFTDRPSYVTYAYYSLIIVWLIAVVHAFYLGRKQEKRL